MKIKKTYKFEVDEQELDAILLGLGRLKNNKWNNKEICFYGWGDRERKTSVPTIEYLIEKISAL